MLLIKQIPSKVTLLCAVLALTLLAACSSDDGDDGPTNPGGTGTDVEIVDFSPDSAYVGDEVQVQGLGFSPVVGDNQIWFNGTEATVDNVSLSEGSDSGTLFTTVPDGATDGPIAVSVEGGDPVESGSEFNVREPVSQEEDEAYARVYWMGMHSRSNGGNPHGVIGTSYTNEEGRKFSEIIYDFGSEMGAYQYAAVDLNEKMIYWTNTTDQFVARAPLDGSATEADTLYKNVGSPSGIALDVQGSNIYWVSGSDMYKGSVEGSESASAEIIYDASDGVGWGYYMDFYIEGDMIYWTDFGDFTTAKVARAPKDGNGQVETLYELDSSFIQGIVIDQEAKTMYIGDGQDDARIFKAPVDGSQPLEVLYSDRNEISTPTLALDKQRGYLYWSTAGGNEGSGIIYRGKADGSGEIEKVYDLRGLSSEMGDGVYSVYSFSVAPESGSAKAKGTDTGYIPPLYLKF